MRIFVLSLLLVSCASETRPVPVLAQTVLRETNDAEVSCPPGLVATKATVRFWLNGDPKSLEMECL